MSSIHGSKSSSGLGGRTVPRGLASGTWGHSRALVKELFGDQNPVDIAAAVNERRDTQGKTAAGLLR